MIFLFSCFSVFQICLYCFFQIVSVCLPVIENGLDRRTKQGENEKERKCQSRQRTLMLDMAQDQKSRQTEKYPENVSL